MVKCTFKGYCELQNVVSKACLYKGDCDFKPHPRQSCPDCPNDAKCKINEPSIQEVCHAKFTDRMDELHAFNCIK